MRSVPLRWRRPLFMGGLVGFGVVVLLAWRFLLSLAHPPPSTTTAVKAPAPTPKIVPLRGVVRDRRSTPQAGITVALYAVPLDDREPSRCGGETPVRLFDETCAAARAEIQRRIDASELASKPLTGVETDEEGRFEFNVSPGRYDVVAVGGTRGFGLVLDVAPGGEPVVIGLGQAVARGNVTIGAGLDRLPIPDAQVAIVLPRPRLVWRAETTPSGEFVMGPVPGGRELIAWSTKDGAFAIGRSTAGAFDLSLINPDPIAGVVRVEGRPAVGAEIVIDGVSRTRSDADGRFTVDATYCPHECWMEAHWDCFSNRRHLWERRKGFASPRESADIGLFPSTALFLSVVDERTQKPVDAIVSASTFHIDGWLPGPFVKRLAAGEYLIRGVSSSVAVDVQAEEYALPSVSLPKLEKQCEVRHTVALSKGLTVEGQVVDVRGSPVRGAEIRVPAPSSEEPKLRSRTITADSEGRFSVDHMNQRCCAVSVNAPGFVEKPASIALGEPLLVTLERAPFVTVHVVSENGRSISGATVYCGNEGKGVATDAEGCATCSMSSSTGLMSIGAEAAGYLRSFAAEDLSAQAIPVKPVEVRLAPQTTLAGRVVDERGRPHPGISLRFSDTSRRMKDLDTVSGSNGEFLLTSAAETEFDVFVLEHARQKENAVLRVRGGDADVRIVLPRKMSVRGVVLKDDTPVSTLKVNGQPVLLAQGAFLFEVPADGDPELHLSGEFTPATVPYVFQPGETVDLGIIRVDPLGLIEGRVRGGEEGTSIVVMPMGQARERKIVELDSQGQFQVSDLEPGRYLVAVNTDRGEVVREGTVRAGRPTTIDVTIPRGATISAPREFP